MIRYVATLMAATALASPLAAAEVQIQVNGPVVEMSVSEQVKAEPDIAEVSAGVTSEAKTAVEAMAKNAQEMTAVIARIKALGIAERDIQTSGISLNAQYNYNQQTNRQIFRAYAVSNRVSVTLRDVPRTGPILDALVAAGATDISGPNFSIENDAGPTAQARRRAMETARERALEYAGWAGYSGVRLLEVSESVSGGPQMYVQRQSSMDMAPQAVSRTPVQPGLVSTGVTVTVKYEMTQ